MSKANVATVLSAWLALSGAASPESCAAASANADLIDIAARMDYGYYAGEARIIEAARADLDRARVAGGAKAYYEAYAAYRLSQLDVAAKPRVRRARLASCVEAARSAAEDTQWAVEAWVLLAACAVEGIENDHSRTLVYEARLTEALAAARAIDPLHPRLLLVAALAPTSANTRIEPDETLATLEEAIEQFDARVDTGIEPAWGEAEAYVQLGRAHLRRGQLREARDVLERSLIVAPDYRLALELRNELSLHR